MISSRGYSIVIVLLGLFCARGAEAACSLVSVSANGVSFGNYSGSMGASSNGSVTASCTLGGNLPSFSVALSAGSGTFAQRKMFFLTASANYNLYTTAGFTTVWGDGTSSTVTQSYTTNTTGTTTSTGFTVYGNMPAGQFPTPGLYGDTITVTVTY